MKLEESRSATAYTADEERVGGRGGEWHSPGTVSSSQILRIPVLLFTALEGEGKRRKGRRKELGEKTPQNE